MRGSALIGTLWMLSLLSFLAVSMGLRTRLEAKMMGIQIRELDQREVLESGVQMARYLIESDPEPNRDHPKDIWFGSHELSRWIPAEGYQMLIEDEEGKINLNRASAQLVRAFLETLRDRGVVLETDTEDLAASIVRWRGETPIYGSPSVYRQKNQPYESLEELLLIEHITVNDYHAVRPFLTVYGRQGELTLRVNPNTAKGEVLEAVIRGLTGDDFAKKDLYDALMTFRTRQSESESPNFLKLDDLSIETLMRKLNLPYTIQAISLLNQFLQVVTLDSSYFGVTVEKADADYHPSHVQAVIGPTGGRAAASGPVQATVSGPATFRADNLEILSWQEGL